MNDLDGFKFINEPAPKYGGFAVRAYIGNKVSVERSHPIYPCRVKHVAARWEAPAHHTSEGKP